MNPLPRIPLGQSDLQVTPVCLGTMTFGEQVNETNAHAILSRSLERGVNFIDTAEMYSVPARAETFGATETIIGNWFAQNPGARDKLVLATKVAGPSRGMPWVRAGGGMTAADITASCHASLKRLHPSVGTQAPAIASFQTCKAMFWSWRYKVIALRHRKSQKLGCDPRANQV